MKLRTLPFLLVSISAASAAVTDLTPPPWQRWTGPGTNQQAIWAEWDFGAVTNPVSPDNEAVISQNPVRCILCTNSVAIPPQAAWTPFDGSGGWLFGAAGQIDGQLTNVVDLEPIKFLQAQIMWSGPLSLAPVFVVDTAFDPTVGGTGTIPLDGGSILNLNPAGTHTLLNDFGNADPTDDLWHGFYQVEITPNPNNENFRIDVAPGTTIDGLIIDTVSVPEPASTLLLGLGGLGLLVRRRRS